MDEINPNRVNIDYSQPSRCSIVVSISACHADDPGSIPGNGAFFFKFCLPFSLSSLLGSPGQFLKSCFTHLPSILACQACSDLQGLFVWDFTSAFVGLLCSECWCFYQILVLVSMQYCLKQRSNPQLHVMFTHWLVLCYLLFSSIFSCVRARAPTKYILPPFQKNENLKFQGNISGDVKLRMYPCL